MEYLSLDEDEIYETQCGEMFFTTKGRLIFHCTLCSMKFDGFDLYEIHIKEHIPIVTEIERHESNLGDFFSNDSDIERNSTYSVKIQSTTDEIALANGDILISPLENQEFTVKSECQDTDEEYYTENSILSENPLKISKLEVHTIDDNEEIVPPEGFMSTTVNKEVENLDKSKMQKRFSLQFKSEVTEYKKKIDKYNFNKNIKNKPDNDLKIPKIVRAVKSHFTKRSLLTPDEERKHKCPVCDAAFKDKHNMIHHLKRHSDNKDHKCPECDKRFFTTSEVNLHLKSHKGERPFLCNICGKSFVYNNQLLTHIKRHTNQRNYKCDICEKAFYDGYLLRNHMVGHSAIRPFICAVDGCGASFARRRTLVNHSKLHQNKKEYKCTLCESRFNQRAGVVSHMKSSHHKCSESDYLKERKNERF